jgi:hypothetical protein
MAAKARGPHRRQTLRLDPSTHHRAHLAHASHHRPTLVHLSRFRVSPIPTHSRLRCVSACVLAVSGVSLVGVSVLSADVAVVVLVALLDPSTRHRAPPTYASHHRPTLVHLSRFIVSQILARSRLRRVSTCVLFVSGVSLVGVSLLSADVAVALVRPEAKSQRVSSSKVDQGPIRKLSSRRTRSCNKLRFRNF